ncbi:(2Fe-2S)-binding protein [Hydrocarboniphaga sp.]|uniref:(2Fe-2S)-binding protein n=1 Tax=Hydrocarboniphaga sp. TaxID=2033016 RepID=UPI003D0EC63B
MYVCVCKAVSDHRIKRMVQDGVTTLREISRETALGTCCGKCVPAARELLSEALAVQPIRLADLAMAPSMTAAA